VTLWQRIEAFKKAEIERTLRDYPNIRQAAAVLGIHRSSLYLMMRSFDIEPPRVAKKRKRRYGVLTLRGLQPPRLS
jgi:hypothetical protein